MRKTRLSNLIANAMVTIAIGTTLVSCSSMIRTESISAKPPKTVTVDGDDTDWPEPMLYDEKSELLVGVKNDGDYLYLCMKTADESAIRRLMTSGITLWFNNQGSNDQSFGLNFPMGSMNQARPIPGLAPKDSIWDHEPNGTARHMDRPDMPPPPPLDRPGEGAVGNEMRPPQPGMQHAGKANGMNKDSMPKDLPVMTDRRPDFGTEPGREHREMPDPLKNATIFINKNKNQIGISRSELESKYKIKTAIKQKDRFLIYELAIPLEKSEYFDLSSNGSSRIGMGITAPEIKIPDRHEKPDGANRSEHQPGMEGGEMPGKGDGMHGGMGGGMHGGRGAHGGGGKGSHRGAGAPDGMDGGAHKFVKENKDEINIWYNIELSR